MRDGSKRAQAPAGLADAAAVSHDGRLIVGWGRSFEDPLGAERALRWQPLPSEIRFARQAQPG
ncbi:MAG TPA: hypothetical protein VJU61_24600 [Polyangiaceae bacterium]|nr:hypothetical protein [Polyangiaceae bacterium]